MGRISIGARAITSAQLADRASRAAAGLASLGVKPGDTVAVYLRNDIAFIEASIAAGLVGAYSVPVNWHYVEAEARYIFEDSGARVVVIHADLYHEVKSALPEGTIVLVVPTPDEIRAAYGLPAEQCIIPSEMTDWNAWLGSFAPYDGPDLPSPGTIIYTSGTTGRPKGVRRPPPDQVQAAAGARMAQIGFGFTDPQEVVTVVTGPMYHSAPNSYGLIAARIGGSVILQTKFDAEELLRTIEQERVTHLHMVPIMFSRLLKLPAEVRSRYDLSSLKFVVHAAAPCPPPVKRDMINWWGPVINEYYGSTETGIVTFCTSEEWLAHPGTVGREVEGTIVRIVDNDGAELPKGEVGEIVSLNPNVPDFTYHGDDTKRRASEVSGLIAPGDVGYLDVDGFLFICDRAKDMIISGGVNIYPAEIESELHKAPGVADCAVFGIPDEEFGESICAAIQLQPGLAADEGAIRDYMREQLASFKLPRRYVFLDELPREDSGKVFKRKLREPFWEGQGRAI